MATNRRPTTAPRLLLPVVKREPEKVRVQSMLTVELHRELLEYQRAYQEMNASEISLDFIIENVLAQHMKRDKAFQTWKITASKPGEAV